MQVEIIAIGDELLSGYVLNTNMQHIAKSLLKEGLAVCQGTIVKDRLDDVALALTLALERSSLVIVTGGLGPTIDDITREAACAVFHVKMHPIPDLEEALTKRYGISHPSIKNQSIQPEGAQVIMNPVGSAPGLIFEKEGKIAVFLPGPPAEMAALFNEIVPIIRKSLEKSLKMYAKWLYLTRLKESEVDPDLRDLQKAYPHLELGIYPAPALLTVSIKGTAMEEIEQVYAAIKSRFKDQALELFDGSLSLTCKTLLTEKGLTLAAAESLSGGHLSALLTKTPGASEYFQGSIIAYANTVKTSALNVPEEVIREKGAVSSEVAVLMAKGVQQLMGASIGVSLTGIAGPLGGTPEKPVGTYFACIVVNDTVHSWTGRGRGTREMIIEWVVNDVLSSLCRIVASL